MGQGSSKPSNSTVVSTTYLGVKNATQQTQQQIQQQRNEFVE